MKTLQHIKNNRLLRLFAALFMTLNLVAVVIGSIGSAYAVSEVKKVVAEYNMASIDNVRTLMDMQFSAGEKLAQDIYLSVNLSSLTGSPGAETPQTRLMAAKLIETIKYGVNTSNTITNAYVLFFGGESVISNTGYFPAEFFFENYTPRQGMDYKAWRAELSGLHDAEYRASELAFPGYDLPVLEYIRPFTIQSRNVRGCVVIQYSNQSILDMLSRGALFSNASVQIRYLPTESYLVSSGSDEVNRYMRGVQLASGEQTLKDTPFGKMIAIRQTSLNRDWEYVSAIPLNVFYNRTDTVFAIMIAILVAQGVLGVVLAYLFSRRSYRPIQRMKESITELAKDIPEQDNGDDLAYIRGITTNAISAYGKAQKQLDMAKPIMAKGFLAQMLHGNSTERDYADNPIAEEFNPFDADGFICVKVLVEECGEFANMKSIEEMQLVKLAISNVAEEMFAASFTALALDYDRKSVAVLLNLPYTEAERERSRLYEALDALLRDYQMIFEEKFKIYTSIGVSRLNRGLSSLYLCNTQADRALEQKMVSEQYGINYYTEEAAAQTSYTYSLDDEALLLNSAKTGDYAGVKSILDAISRENEAVFANGDLQTAQCFIMDMAGTLVRLTAEVNAPPEVLSFNLSRLMALPSYPRMIEEIYRSYETLCTWVQKNKKSHNGRTKKKVESYIAEHYLDNSLSLASVADHLGMNTTYLSAFIKEQFGETFLNYVLDLRMEKAKELLRTTDLSLQDIAVRIGYANSGVFIRVFKKKYGYTPGTYRVEEEK